MLDETLSPSRMQGGASRGMEGGVGEGEGVRDNGGEGGGCDVVVSSVIRTCEVQAVPEAR